MADLVADLKRAQDVIFDWKAFWTGPATEAAFWEAPSSRFKRPLVQRCDRAFTSDHPDISATSNCFSNLGNEVRWLVGRARDSLPVRGLLGANEIPALALKMEPAKRVRVYAAALPNTPRLVMLQAISDSKDLIFWTSGQKALPTALGLAIRTDPMSYVRIEALRAIGLAPIPVTWVPTLLDAITRAEETLPETPFGTQERQTLAKYLREVKGKLQSVAASAAQQAAQARPANAPEPTVGAELALPRVKPKSDHKPWLALGAAVVLFAGVALWARRRDRGALAAPEPYSGLISDEEGQRLDTMTARQARQLAELTGEQLDQVAAGLVRRHGISDAALRKKLLENAHPDDLDEALARHGRGALLGAKDDDEVTFMQQLRRQQVRSGVQAYTEGKWTPFRAGETVTTLIVESPAGMWQARVHKDGTWSVRGPNPDDEAHYGDGEVKLDYDRFAKTSEAERAAVTDAKKAAKAFIKRQLG